jgi:hypothetical protein
MQERQQFHMEQLRAAEFRARQQAHAIFASQQGSQHSVSLSQTPSEVDALQGSQTQRSVILTPSAAPVRPPVIPYNSWQRPQIPPPQQMPQQPPPPPQQQVLPPQPLHQSLGGQPSHPMVGQPPPPQPSLPQQAMPSVAPPMSAPQTRPPISQQVFAQSAPYGPTPQQHNPLNQQLYEQKPPLMPQSIAPSVQPLPQAPHPSHPPISQPLPPPLPPSSAAPHMSQSPVPQPVMAQLPQPPQPPQPSPPMSHQFTPQTTIGIQPGPQQGQPQPVINDQNNMMSSHFPPQIPSHVVHSGPISHVMPPNNAQQTGVCEPNREETPTM